MNDTGSSENATGTATQIASGHLGPAKTFRQLRYTIADGDTLIGIDNRFQACRDDVVALNSVFEAFDAANLKPGQRLLLGRISEQPFSASCA